MTDNANKEGKPKGNESFAELLEAYSGGMRDGVQVGDRISGKVIAIGKDSVFFDTGTKVDGVVDKKELLDDNGELPYEAGDTIELYVVAADETEIHLSRALSGIGGLHLLEDAYRNEIPVEGKITETCKGGYRVELMHRRAFCPVSQVDIKYVDKPEDYVGETFLFVITQFEDNGRNIVVSRRSILEKEQRELEQAFLAGLTVGAEVKGTVTRLMPYGVFVELVPGLEGMIHISEMSWSRLERPEDVVKTGDAIQVKVIGIEDDDRPNRKKIALSVKALSGDPWESISERFQPGDKIKGKVTRCAKFGAFVEIAPGIEGLVHISEMSYIKRIVKPEEIVRPGDTVQVMIKEYSTEGRRVALSIRDAEGDPWIEVPEKYRPGQVVKGTLEKKEKFGFFVSLEPGVTGLLPKSKISQAPKPSAIERLKEGNAITVVIERVSVQDRKISLSPGDSADAQDWQKFAADRPSSMSSLGEKLKAALESKKDT
jgi:small subunit ribosomal protein S1